MKINRVFFAFIMATITSLSGCSSGDADQNVVRNLFAVGDIFEGVEDGDPIQGDVSLNDQGEGLTFALAPDSSIETVA